MPLASKMGRPVGFYDVLKRPQPAVARKMSRRLASARRGSAYALLRYATSPELLYKLPGLRPSPEFFRTKDYVSSNKPAQQASSKGPAPRGGGGGSGGGSGTSLLSAIAAIAPQPSGPSRPAVELAGQSRERGYTYG